MFFTSFLIVVPNIAHGVIEIGHITKAVIDNIIIEIKREKKIAFVKFTYLKKNNMAKKNNPYLK